MKRLLTLPIAVAVGLAACSDSTKTPLAPDPAALPESVVPQASVASVAQQQITERVVMGNQTCSQTGYHDFELKVDPVAGGTYSDGTLSVTITVVSTPAGPTFNFTSNIGVDAVLVKGGPDGNLYEYDPEVKSGTGLHAPLNPNNGKYYGLSHISFCYDVGATKKGTKFEDKDADGKEREYGEPGLPG